MLPIEDIFTITGRGTVATGRIERGVIHLADTVERVGLSDTTATYVVTGIEMFRKSVDQAQAGDNVGILLRGADRNDLKRGKNQNAASGPASKSLWKESALTFRIKFLMERIGRNFTYKIP